MLREGDIVWAALRQRIASEHATDQPIRLTSKAPTRKLGGRNQQISGPVNATSTILCVCSRALEVSRLSEALTRCPEDVRVARKMVKVPPCETP